MTLKEKFETTMVSFLIDKNQDKTMLDHFDKIADEFAIGFAEWCLKIKFEPIENISVKRLLEIYKKEKGL
jgi:hypothetical protein